MARWKLADNAPPHYVQGCGVVEGGQEFEYSGEPSSQHWLRPDGGAWIPADAPARAAKSARKVKGAASAASDTPPEVESTEPAPAGEEPAGEF